MKKYLLILLLFGACAQPEKEAQTEEEPSGNWVENATIYEVNVRQYSSAGDLASFEKDIPRLKELGVDVLWFMPIQPIGKLNRRCTMLSC